MNSLNQLLVIDVNIIIHLEKVNLLDELINDRNIRIVDLVLYQEYQYKKNKCSDKVSNIETVCLSENQVAEAYQLYLKNRRNSVFDYFSYIVARDNGYILLTGDWKLKKVINSDIEVRGAIWYVKYLNENGIISDEKLLSVYKTWLEDVTVFMPSEILLDLIIELENKNVVCD